MSNPVYQVHLKPSVEKDLEMVPSFQIKKILRLIQDLKDDPLPPGSIKLRGLPWYRLRSGNYRVIYSISQESAEIEIIKVGHRKDIYRKVKSTF